LSSGLYSFAYYANPFRTRGIFRKATLWVTLTLSFTQGDIEMGKHGFDFQTEKAIAVDAHQDFMALYSWFNSDI
jgi:hypothetical protein